jgi:hypothetical protein
VLGRHDRIDLGKFSVYIAHYSFQIPATHGVQRNQRAHQRQALAIHQACARVLRT